MKRLWICAGLVLALLTSTLLNSRHIARTVTVLTGQLADAHRLTADDDWEQAARITGQALTLWEKQDFYFHIMLPHRDIDEIRLSFREVAQYLALEEADQYNAANARLIEQLGLLAEMEQLNLKNIL